MLLQVPNQQLVQRQWAEMLFLIQNNALLKMESGSNIIHNLFQFQILHKTEEHKALWDANANMIMWVAVCHHSKYWVMRMQTTISQARRHQQPITLKQNTVLQKSSSDICSCWTAFLQVIHRHQQETGKEW